MLIPKNQSTTSYGWRRLDETVTSRQRCKLDNSFMIFHCDLFLIWTHIRQFQLISNQRNVRLTWGRVRSRATERFPESLVEEI